MKARTTKPVRCAIYTRVSTDQGLEQDFNSLDAQRDAAEAYIRSQAHAAWTIVRNRYDDGGFSGGSTDRPALQRLLTDVKATKVDVIVVYKVDRLTRSLADFAKLVELFDGHGVSFVSVTQQFNTTTSMGRLTLNVLLSFAQFEREVTSERIRDKIAASKRKGLWVGGRVPLGYEVKDRKIVVVKRKAELVRAIFRSYLKLGSIDRLANDLRKQGAVTNVTRRKNGKAIGGNPFTRGPLSYLLRNRFYIGQVVYKGDILPGSQTPIVDARLFNAVQAKLAEQQNNHVKTRAKSEALLIGRLFDDRGNRMSPSHTRKQGIKYRYYISRPLLEGRKDKAGSVSRVPADEIENVVTKAMRRSVAPGPEISNGELIRTYLTRVEVHPAKLIVELKPPNNQRKSGDSKRRKTLHVSWQKPPTKRRRDIIVPDSMSRDAIRPIRSDARARLIAAIARGRNWLDELVTSSVSDVDAIAKREHCSVRKINMTISLAFLAPDLVKTAIEGRLPRGIGIARLCDPPADWSGQYRKLGLTSPYLAH
jgi:DNA invertase Pin-like site-specific DNA recombinase